MSPKVSSKCGIYRVPEHGLMRARIRYHDYVIVWNFLHLDTNAFKSPTVRMTKVFRRSFLGSNSHSHSSSHKYRQRIGTNGAVSAATLFNCKKKAITMPIDSPPANLLWGEPPRALFQCQQ
jgi:hypothetical protein